jgi:hypothetical protein
MLLPVRGTEYPSGGRHATRPEAVRVVSQAGIL